MSDDQKFFVCEITLRLQNEEALRAEACNVAPGPRPAAGTGARAYLDSRKQTLEQCALLLAPAHSPAGTDVLGAVCEEAEELVG